MRIKKDKNIRIFLDSGAFSAFTQKVEIKIEDYISFVKENEKYLHVYSNLDVIGDPATTWKNQIIMENAGLKPLPTFHYGSNLKWLKRILSKYEYMALGGMVPIPTRALVPWLDDLYKNHLCDKDGVPKIKVHGFGVSSIKLLLRYPWYSVDSTSWIFLGKKGKIFVPRKTNGKWDYTKVPIHVPVTKRSAHIKIKGEHFENISPAAKKMVLEYIKYKGFCLGESKIVEKPLDYVLKEDEVWINKKSNSSTKLVEVMIERGLSNDYIIRDQFNIEYFMEVEKSLPKWPWPFKIDNTEMGFQL
jgi:hypothetical protein